MNRLLEVVLALGLLVVASPLFLIAAVSIRLVLGHPVFLRQQRPGRHGRPFVLLKFRTMSEERDAAGRLLPDGARLGRLGRWLRATSIDELPEVLNVLRGDMSLVGPRPLRMEYLGRYSPEQARRHEVKPGITGWAQVNGRNLLSWPERFELDVWYVDHRSVGLDLKILLLTVVAVVRGRGISAHGEATMTPFTGTH